jgi:hypothetical protein
MLLLEAEEGNKIKSVHSTLDIGTIRYWQRRKIEESKSQLGLGDLRNWMNLNATS